MMMRAIAGVPELNYYDLFHSTIAALLKCLPLAVLSVRRYPSMQLIFSTSAEQMPHPRGEAGRTPASQ